MRPRIIQRRRLKLGDHVMIGGKSPVWLVCHIYEDASGQYLEMERREAGTGAHQRAACGAENVVLIEKFKGGG